MGRPVRVIPIHRRADKKNDKIEIFEDFQSFLAQRYPGFVVVVEKIIDEIIGDFDVFFRNVFS